MKINLWSLVKIIHNYVKTTASECKEYAKYVLVDPNFINLLLHQWKYCTNEILEIETE